MGPFKCPDCGIWWAGFEHRCQIDLSRVPSGAGANQHDVHTVRCTCNDPDVNATSNRPEYPLHGTATTFTGKSDLP